jgi:hypothetical protein
MLNVAEGINGGAEGDRTLDLRIANATLSQLSYRPTIRRAILASRIGTSSGESDKSPSARSSEQRHPEIAAGGYDRTKGSRGKET